MWNKDHEKSCTLCNYRCESVAHLMNSCRKFSDLYSRRHDRVVDAIHMRIEKLDPSLKIFANKMAETIFPELREELRTISHRKPDLIIFFLFNIKIYKTRYLRLLDYKLLNYITRTITREARNHDYPKGHLGRNPITFDQIPTVLDSWIFVDVGYVGFGKVIGILP